MSESPLHVVTGAFGYSGGYIAQRLLERGCRVRTLTNSPGRDSPLQGRVEAVPYHFDDPQRLAASLEGGEVLYNTYWVRFNHPSFTHAQAVANTRVLFQAARQAGLRRVVHVSIILINNIAWMLRRFPLFGVFGDGQYKLQPIFVDDLAKLAVDEGAASGCRTIDAVGPETFTYRELVQAIGRIIGKPRPIVPVPPALGYLFAAVLGKIVGDTIVTREEIEGLMQNLLFTNSPPAGETRLTDWARQNAATLGIRYTSELVRRRDRAGAYERL